MRKLFRFIRKVPEAFNSRSIGKTIHEFFGGQNLTLLDIGAAGGIEPRWGKISSVLNYIGLEPDKREQEIKLLKKFRNYELLPYAAGEKEEEISFHITKQGGKSSSYTPNHEFLKRFVNSSRFDVVSTEKIMTKQLDQIITQSIDFIKIDIQGSELNVLKGATKTLEKTFGVEVEVEFLKLYKSQPLFGDVYEFLSDQGFEFIDFVNLCRWERDSFKGAGQLTFGDALFLRSPESVSEKKLSDSEVVKYLAILFIYNRFDLIEQTFFLHPHFANSLSRFYKRQKKQKIYFNIIFKINRLLTAFFSLFGVEYRSHVLY